MDITVEKVNRSQGEVKSVNIWVGNVLIVAQKSGRGIDINKFPRYRTGETWISQEEYAEAMKRIKAIFSGK